MNGEISEALSAYALSVRYETLRPGDHAHLLNAFANWVGCAYGGSRHSTFMAGVRGFLALGPNGAHATFGRPERFNLVDAVSLDCLSSAVLSFDDAHLETVLHPTGPIAAALLGLARMQKVSGKDYIAALHVGMEIECRIGLAFASAGSGASGGWYATGLSGGIGAAAAVGRLMGFDQARIKNAMGMAAARACGNRGTHGSPAAAYVPSMAAESGIISAMLTREGLLCGARALDGVSGLLELITVTPLVERALRGLGEMSESALTGFKPYPSGIVVHPVIDACFELRNKHGVAAEQVDQLAVLVSPTAYRLVANKLPKGATEAQISLYFWAAVVLEHGQAGVKYLTDQAAADPKLRTFQERVSAEVSDLGDDQCIVTARLKDGRTINIKIEHALGSAPHPMTSADIDRKFMDLVGPVLTEGRAHELLARCRGITSLDDVTSVLELGNAPH